MIPFVILHRESFSLDCVRRQFPRLPGADKVDRIVQHLPHINQPLMISRIAIFIARHASQLRVDAVARQWKRLIPAVPQGVPILLVDLKLRVTFHTTILSLNLELSCKFSGPFENHR